MALQISQARGPHLADLPNIPAEFINPKNGQVDFWEGDEYRAAVEEAEESGEPFVAPPLRSGSPIDVRECLASGAAVLPTEWPAKGVPEPAGDAPGDGYEKMKVAELKDIARDAGVNGYETMKKAELIEAIRE